VHCYRLIPAADLWVVEVVLAVLLSSFTVEMSDKPIEWNVAGVWYPTVGKQSDQPQLPMKLSLYKGPKS